MIWQTLSVSQISERLKTDKTNGLSTDEAEQRLISQGKNELHHEKSKSIFERFLQQFNDYMIIILLVAAAVSLAIAVYEGNNDFAEPIVIISIVILNAFIGVIQEEKAQKALDSLKDMMQPTAVVVRNGVPTTINATDLVYGDIIMLKAGDFVPADARIINCSNFYTDESSLTGESNPVYKSDRNTYPEQSPVADMNNMIWSSTAVTCGNCTAVVTETGMSTQVGKIAKAIIESESPKTPLQVKLASTGKVLGTLALVICAIVFATGTLRKIPPLEMFMTSVSLAVAAIPEGLPAIVTIMLALGIQKMAKKNAIVKKLPAVETLGSASVICTDKTGTLTQNKMTVKKIYGNKKDVIKTVLLCLNNTDPTENAIKKYADEHGICEKKHLRLKEFPFSSEAKFMATINKFNDQEGYLFVIKGAPDIIIKKCSMDEVQRKDIQNALNEMTSNALRVIAVAYKKTDVFPNGIQNELTFCGLIGIFDPPRPEVYQAIKSCKRAGIKPVMITGDHSNTAAAIAKEIGMSPIVLTGTELDKMSDKKLSNNIKKYSVFARVTPEHKVRIVRAFQSNNEVVAMTGDGVNDAPALKQADIGCAMGITGTDVAKNASDMILTDDNFATIVEAILEGRCIFANIKKAVHFLFSSNIGEILTIFCAIIFGLPSPLSAVQLLWVNLITDSLPAIALGVDTNNRQTIMSEKPIKRNQSIFANGRGLTIFTEGIMIGSLSLLAFCLGYFNFSDCNVGRTMAFCVLSMSQLVHSYNVRSDFSAFSPAVPQNNLLHISLLLGVVLQVMVVVSPMLSKCFGTVLLNITQWKIVCALSISPLFLVETSKLIYKKSKPYTKL